ncbi:unnamed protein product (macronuclear) [Paramecium tetraurelia]|uniref:Fungal lipase-type domain-containing protein n=1 Tax=Paramecium tetraurelia TaxID=5888 RepID=A0BCU5_PARTE|nr:uncharacterized protein GSPATT00004456001 [Paramecium tetraurelia]CAK56362.1 unnamed protein product [Paramecium tetraurelia]|eukprot:XP_001423760.1 hypothetical protein (macronuclear) [Paramecium tetraurelia strain d4-2]
MKFDILFVILILTVSAHAQDDDDFIIDSSSEYDETAATRYWYFCAASYCNPNVILNWSCTTPCSKTPYMDDVQIFVNATNENAGYSGYDPKHNEIIIVFRGTLPWSIKNWFEDINYIKTSFPYCTNNCQVHRGFYYSYLGIQDQVLNAAKRLTSKYPNAKLVITGHSLGGALSTHALVALTVNGYRVDHYYSFGSPRVGDSAFFNYVKSIYPSAKFRVTHDHDPVPHLPMEVQGFHHINTEAYYKDFLIFHKDVKICNDEKKEDPRCSNQNLLDLSVDDHCNYLGYNLAIGVLVCQ